MRVKEFRFFTLEIFICLMLLAETSHAESVCNAVIDRRDTVHTLEYCYETSDFSEAERGCILSAARRGVANLLYSHVNVRLTTSGNQIRQEVEGGGCFNYNSFDRLDICSSGSIGFDPDCSWSGW